MGHDGASRRRRADGTAKTGGNMASSRIDALRNQPATEYLVVDGGGTVLGVLSTSDVERVFSDV